MKANCYKRIQFIIIMRQYNNVTSKEKNDNNISKYKDFI